MKAVPVNRRHFLATLGASAALAQEPTDVIKVDVELVNIFCSVRDKRGAFVGSLEKDAFKVFEEGKEQEIRYFARESDLPLTIGLLVDVSGSQEGLIETEKRAASAFFKQVLRKKDMAFVISFGSEAELLQDYTNSQRLLEDGLAELRVNSAVGGFHPSPTGAKTRGTIMFDAVYLAADEKLKREVGRKVIVLITDGVDMGSRTRISSAIEAAQKADAIIYAIQYIDYAVYAGWGVSDGDLKKMAEETGGRVFRVSNKNDLETIFAQIQDEMRHQYAIGYTPTSTTPGYRKLEIKTTEKGYKVQARKGYYSSS